MDSRVACPRFQQGYTLRHCLQASSGTDRKLLCGRWPSKAVVRFAATVISPLGVIASAGIMIKAPQIARRTTWLDSQRQQPRLFKSIGMREEDCTNGKVYESVWHVEKTGLYAD